MINMYHACPDSPRLTTLPDAQRSKKRGDPHKRSNTKEEQEEDRKQLFDLDVLRLLPQNKKRGQCR